MKKQSFYEQTDAMRIKKLLQDAVTSFSRNSAPAFWLWHTVAWDKRAGGWASWADSNGGLGPMASRSFVTKILAERNNLVSSNLLRSLWNKPFPLNTVTLVWNSVCMFRIQFYISHMNTSSTRAPIFKEEEIFCSVKAPLKVNTSEKKVGMHIQDNSPFHIWTLSSITTSISIQFIEI